MGKYEAITVAKYLLSKQPMSQKKLHKMLFFSYAWYLYRHNDDVSNLKNRLFEPVIPKEGFQAWVHGPVFREIYPEFKRAGYKDIYLRKFDDSIIDDGDKQFFDEIFDVYGKYSADELEEQSHNFKSWINAREGYDRYEPCKTLMKDEEIYVDIDSI